MLSFWGTENVLKSNTGDGRSHSSVTMQKPTGLSENFKGVSFTTCELYLHNGAKKNDNKKF